MEGSKEPANWLLEAERKMEGMAAKSLKVVALNGSARKGGNTAILLGYVLRELENEGIETELIEMSGATIHGCLACRECSARKDRRCSQSNDLGRV